VILLIFKVNNTNKPQEKKEEAQTKDCLMLNHTLGKNDSKK